jgi:hypothetical protein
VEEFLEKVRQHSGLFVERGENLYGFMHLTFEEFFAARHMVRSVQQARAEILQRLHQPRWREPTLLAVGLLSRTPRPVSPTRRSWRRSHHGAWLLDQLLRRLDRLTKSFDPGAIAEEGAEETSWPARGVVNAVLAELSDRATPKLFARGRQLSDVVALLTRAGTDPNNWRSRYFSIRALGNLQQFTIGVADVLFAACRDVRPVYQETSAVVGRFKAFGPGSLERLSRAAADPSSTVAYRAAQLLAELGLQRSEELGAEGRGRIAEVLDGLLQERSCDRAVYDFTDRPDGGLIGPLSDTIYEALVRVVGGPDAAPGANPAGDATPGTG